MTLPKQLVAGLFLTLGALYSPLAAAAAYGPIIGDFDPSDRRRVAFRLFVSISLFLVVVVSIGELLLEIVGVSTNALGAAGGLALLYAGVPMMRGIEQVPPEDPLTSESAPLRERTRHGARLSLRRSPSH